MSARPRAGVATRNGRASQAQGASWESVLHDALDHAQRRGTVRQWWASYPKMVPTRKDGVLRYIPVGKGPPDLVVLLSSGLAILADAKQTGAGEWAFSELKQHQADRLGAWHCPDQNMIAGVLLSMQGAAWWLPWDTLGPLWTAWASVKRAKAGGASLTPERCAEIGRRVVVGDVVGAMS